MPPARPPRAAPLAVQRIDRTEVAEALGELKPAVAAVLELQLEAHNANADALKDFMSAAVPNAPASRTARRSIEVAMPPDAPWILATLTAPTVAGGVPLCAYLMEPGGRVSLRGYSEATANGGEVFPLPAAGYTRAGEDIHVPATSDTPAFLQAEITSAGSVLKWGAIGGGCYLDGISYLASPAAAPHRFTGPGWPILVKHDLPKVTGLVVEACRARRKVGIEAAGAPYVDWEDAGDGMVRIHAVWGLSWGKTYDVRVVLSAED